MGAPLSVQEQILSELSFGAEQYVSGPRTFWDEECDLWIPPASFFGSGAASATSKET